MYVCVHACACVCERRAKICHKMCTNKKKKAYVQEDMQTKQKKENHIQRNNKESRKGVKKKTQTEKKEREVQQNCRSDKEKKTKTGTKGREMKNVMEMKTDKNLIKGGEETRKGRDRKGGRVNGINTHRSVQQSGLAACSNINNFPINLIHSLSVTEVNLSRMSLTVTHPCLSGKNAYLSECQTRR